jgi:hypothetical protein
MGVQNMKRIINTLIAVLSAIVFISLTINIYRAGRQLATVACFTILISVVLIITEVLSSNNEQIKPENNVTKKIEYVNELDKYFLNDGILGDLICAKTDDGHFMSLYVPHVEVDIPPLVVSKPTKKVVNIDDIKREVISKTKDSKKDERAVINLLSTISEYEDTTEFLEENHKF